MTPKHLSPLDRMKRDNSPTAIDRWNESYARWEEAQREKFKWDISDDEQSGSIAA